MLNYLQRSTQPEISMAIHQCAPFFNNSRIVHKRVVGLISKYLANMSTYVDLLYVNQQLTTCGVVYRPDIYKVIEFYIDAYFDSIWSQEDADNAKTIIPRTGCVITYALCPVLWLSKLQMGI